MASNSKKRPNNLVLGRMFDHKILDMIELGIEAFTPLADIDSHKKAPGAKPCFIFQGDQFEHEQ